MASVPLLVKSCFLKSLPSPVFVPVFGCFKPSSLCENIDLLDREVGLRRNAELQQHRPSHLEYRIEVA